MEEFPQLRAVVEQGFDNPANVEIVSLYNLTQMYFLVFEVWFFLTLI